MTSVENKTPNKPKVESKESSPAVKNNKDERDSKDEVENNNRNRNDNRQGRENRFQNRRGGHGGRNMNRNWGNRGGHQGRDSGGGGQNQNFNLNPPQTDFTGEMNEGPKEQKKFTGRCRLFVGNITPDTTEEQFKEMFTPFGEVSELFVNAARGFGFIRLDYRINAEKAKIELDGQMRNNRVLRVRFATHGAALKIFNLSPFVSNELLEKAFSQFGEVERAVVFVDDRGKSLCEGLVEFARKPGAQAAFKRINEGVFLLSSFPRPVRVEMLEQRDEDDGLTEKFVQRNDGFRQDREKEPRFAPPGAFEYEFGLKHREIDNMERERIEMVKKDMEQERHRLAEEMETAVFDFQAEQIRQDLMRQQEELKRLDEMKNEHVRRRQEQEARRKQQMGGVGGPPDSMMRREEEERRREMMMRASNEINRGRDGGMNQGGPNRGLSGRPDDMMRGDRPGGMMESRPNDNRGPNTPPMPMAPPPVPPGMNMEPGRQPGPGGNMDGPRFPMPGGSPGGDRPKMDMDRPVGMDRPPHGNMDRPMKGDHMQRPGPGGPPGRFPGPQGPGGPGNFPPGPGGMPNRFPNMPPGGPMGPNNPNMRGDRREPPRRDDFDPKRMRRF
ncbi:paraspeckle component 1-like isoform X2 [Mya arenaria]|uniref:paraspeckle component 1-like isoform X2 n=1 Tax=Mya arenaria TaxID=6604 RepID=UPI0022E2505B|nr:paraspeckle component 1-like isoform X2 [Mya arenaria]XP_052810577.1 paraspeckle component 1-like isoform X2 [Mya arenaria]